MTTQQSAVPKPFFRSDAYPFYSIIYPHAEYYRGRTYVAFQHTSMDPYVMAFDHEKGTWSKAVRVANNPIDDHDTHGNPALWVDNEGRIHLMYGCHGGPAKHVRSTAPQDITSWERLPDAAPKCTYPQISRFGNGDVLFFFRAGTHSIKEQRHAPWGFEISRDGGHTWGTFRQVTNGQGDIYASSAIGPDDSIHMTMVWESPPKIGRQNVYYVCLDHDGRLSNAVGTGIHMPFGLDDLDKHHCKIYDTGGDQTTYTPTMAFSADGTLWVAFPSVGTREFICGIRRGKSPFLFTPVAKTCNNWASDALIQAGENGVATLYVTPNGRANNEGNMGGNLYRYITRDGGRSWIQDCEIAADRVAYGAITLVHNAHPDGKIVFCNRDDNTIYLWGRRGFVRDRGTNV